MTPKEKAEALVSKYEELGRDFTKGVSMKELAKQSTLIAIDEIIGANPYKWTSFMNQYTEMVLTSDNGYWIAVKEEIQKL